MSFLRIVISFYSLGEFDYLADIREYLPEELLEKYKDDLVYVKSIETGKKYPIGIKLEKKCLGEGNRLVSGYLCGRSGRRFKKQGSGSEIYRRKHTGGLT